MDQPNQSPKKKGGANHQKGKRFQTDSEKIVQRHLGDKNDVITDEDIRGVQIFTGLPPSDTVATGAEAESLLKEEEKEQPSDRPATPWDTVA